MNIVLASVNNKSYQSLADITMNNKFLYANQHGYQTFFKNSNFKFIPNDNLQPTPNPIGWEKINTILEAFESNPMCNYVWLSDCDTLITNKDIKLESIIAKYTTDIMVTCDRGGINTGSIFCKNTPATKTYLACMLQQKDSYRDENQYVIENNNHKLISVIPQKLINSYDYGDHQEVRHTIYASTNDVFGLDGQWRPKDFLIHWAAGTLACRLELAPIYLNLIDGKLSYELFSSAIRDVMRRNPQ